MPFRAQERSFTVGHSAAEDSAAAGEQAAADAIGRDEAKLVLVFASNSHDLEAVVGAVAEHAGDAPLIGCSTAGEIASDGPGDGGVVVAAFSGSGFSAATAEATNASADMRAAGAVVGECIDQIEQKGHTVLMLLSDGVAGDQQELVRGAYGVVGAGVPLVGGCASDGMKMGRTFQFHGKGVLSDGVVAAAISSTAPMGIGVRHGWRRVGEPMLVTRSEGKRVFEIDNRPALDLYFESHDAPEEARTDPVVFNSFARTHPLGLPGRRGAGQIRCVGEADFESRSLGCTAGVPQGGLAWFMEGDRNSVIDSGEAACADALSSLNGAGPLGMVAFDCVGRRGVLGDDGGLEAEVRRVAERGGAPVAGFYTYGEIARTNGVSGFHNQTLVVLAVG